MLVDTAGELVFEYLDDVVEDAGGDWDVLVNPWDVPDDRDLDGREVIIAETSFFFLGLREAALVD